MDQGNFLDLTDIRATLRDEFSSSHFLKRSFASSVAFVANNWPNSTVGYVRTKRFFPGPEYGICTASNSAEPNPTTEFLWATMLNRVKEFEGQELDSFPSGFVCCVEFQSSHRDRSSELASDGFFDRFDLPPSECWLTVKREHLVFWVPEELHPNLLAGIRANCIELIHLLFPLSDLETKDSFRDISC